jgi:hypothetical protein
MKLKKKTKKRLITIGIVVAVIAAIAAFLVFGPFKQTILGDYSLSVKSVEQGEVTDIEFFYGVGTGDYGVDYAPLWSNQVYMYLDDEEQLTSGSGTMVFPLNTSDLGVGEHEVTFIVARACTNNDCGGSQAVRDNVDWIPGSTYQEYLDWECNPVTYPERVSSETGLPWHRCDVSASDIRQVPLITEIRDTFRVTEPTTTTTPGETTTTVPIDGDEGFQWVNYWWVGAIVIVVVFGIIFRKDLMSMLGM